VATYTYDAWGNHIIRDKDETVIYESISGTTPGYETHIGNLNPIRYRGYYYDIETNLYYLKTRYYDPQTGRFLNMDKIEILDYAKGFINGLNLFAYCLNNPVNYFDSDGLSASRFFRGFFRGLLRTIFAPALNLASTIIGFINNPGQSFVNMGLDMVGFRPIRSMNDYIFGFFNTYTNLGHNISTGNWEGIGDYFGMRTGQAAVILGSLGVGKLMTPKPSMAGQTFQGVGTVIKKPKISWSSSNIHAGKRMVERGVSTRSVNSTFKRGRLVFQQSTDRFLIVGRKSTIVTTSSGRLITAWHKIHNRGKLLKAIRRVRRR